MTRVWRLEGAASYLAWPCPQGQVTDPGGRQSRFWYCEHSEGRMLFFNIAGNKYRLSSQAKFIVNSVPKPFIKDWISSSGAAPLMATKRR